MLGSILPGDSRRQSLNVGGLLLELIRLILCQTPLQNVEEVEVAPLRGALDVLQDKAGGTLLVALFQLNHAQHRPADRRIFVLGSVSPNHLNRAIDIPDRHIIRSPIKVKRLLICARFFRLRQPLTSLVYVPLLDRKARQTT